MPENLAEHLQRLTVANRLFERTLNLIEELRVRSGHVPDAHVYDEAIRTIECLCQAILQKMGDKEADDSATVSQKRAVRAQLAFKFTALTTTISAWIDTNRIPEEFDVTNLGSLIEAYETADQLLRPQWASYVQWGRSAIREFVADQYDNLLDSVGGMTESRLTQANAVGTWSIRDILAHVLAWEEYGWVILSQWPEPKAGSLARWGVGVSVGETNAILLASYATKDLIDVLGDLYTYRRRTLRFIDKSEEPMFESIGSWGWNESGTLVEFLISMACHQTEHAEDIFKVRETCAIET